jgi:hypothetical protein
LLLATSHFVGFAVVLGSGVLVALSITSRAVGTAEGRRVLACLGLVLLPSAWLVPIYLPLIRAVGPISTEFKFFTPLTWSNLTSHVEFLYRDFAWLWRVLLVGSISAPVLLLGERRSTLWRVTTAMLVATVLTALITREARSTYLLTTYIGLGVALIASAWGSPRRMGGRSTVGAFAVAFLTVAGISQVVIGARFFPEQRLYYALLSPDLVSGIEEVGRSSEVADTLAVTSLHDAPLGWWVEALTRRSTYYGAPLRWLLFPDEADRARIANELFVPPFPNGETMQMAGEAGIDLILVPTRWVFFDEGAIDEFEEAFPGSVEYVSPELVAIAVTEGRP